MLSFDANGYGGHFAVSVHRYENNVGLASFVNSIHITQNYTFRTRLWFSKIFRYPTNRLPCPTLSESFHAPQDVV